MGSLVGSAVFSAAVFFYCLGVIFSVVGHIGAWLEPRDNSSNPDKTGDILGVHIRTACFREYSGFDVVYKKTFDGCFDTTKNSADFDEIPAIIVRPGTLTAYYFLFFFKYT